MRFSLIRTFWQHTINGGVSLFADPTGYKLARVWLLVEMFYFLLALLAASAVSSFMGLPRWQEVYAAEAACSPVWVLRWMSYTDYATSVTLVYLLLLVGTFIALFTRGRYWWSRLAAAVGLMSYAALVASFGKIDHSLHVPVVVSCFFVFLPDGTQSCPPPPRKKQHP